MASQPKQTICYMDKNTLQCSYIDTNLTVEEYQKEHPDHVIGHVYGHQFDQVNYQKKCQADFYNNCDQYGIPMHFLNQTFKHKGETYKLIGMSNKNRKYKCILLDVETDQTIRTTPGFVKSGFDPNYN